MQQQNQSVSQTHPIKSPVPNLMQVPSIPAGEDEHSFERLNNMLKSEYKKQRPRKEVLVELMRATYPQRRVNVLETSTPVADLLIKYPFLGKEEQASSIYQLASVEPGVHQHRPSHKNARAHRNGLRYVSSAVCHVTVGQNVPMTK